MRSSIEIRTGDSVADGVDSEAVRTPSTGPATLTDVAQAAGVSLATASRVLNGSSRKVAEAYRERVLAAAARLQYSTNTSAQAVARGRSRSVALVVGDIADPYFSSIAAGVAKVADERGLMLTITMTGGAAARELAVVSALRGQRPEVILLAGSRTADMLREQLLERELRAFEAEGGRIAVIGQAALPFSTVVPDNYGGARDLALDLVDAGYRRFAVLSGPAGLLTAIDRLTGFRDGLGERNLGLAPDRIVPSDFTRDGGYAAAARLLDEEIEVDAVFAVNDVMAVGAMACLRDRGREFPDGPAVAGFDDIHTLRDLTPSLTTVRLPLEELGSAALRVALDQDSRAVVPVDAHVIMRGSTPAVR